MLTAIAVIACSRLIRMPSDLASGEGIAIKWYRLLKTAQA